MGGGAKELNVIDLIRQGDSQTAIKILLKNKCKTDCLGVETCAKKEPTQKLNSSKILPGII